MTDERGHFERGRWVEPPEPVSAMPDGPPIYPNIYLIHTRGARRARWGTREEAGL